MYLFVLKIAQEVYLTNVRKLGFTVFKKIYEEFMLNFCQVIKLELKNVLH